MVFLLSQVDRLGNGSVNNPELALINIMQYITRSRSQLLKDDDIKEAQKILHKTRDADIGEAEKYIGLVSDKDKEAIEECAFAHKGIFDTF